MASVQVAPLDHTVVIAPKVTKARKPKDPNAPAKPRAPAGAKGKKAPADKKNAKVKGAARKKEKPLVHTRLPSKKNIIKGPTTAWIVFLNKERAELLRTKPNMTLPQISSMLSQRWARMSKAEKDPYEKEAAEDKTRYQQAKDNLTDEQRKILKLIKKKKKEKKEDEPVKPKSGYMFFATLMRQTITEQNKGISFSETGKKLGEAWNALPADKRETYEQLHREDDNRYRAEMEVYNKKKEDEKAEKRRIAAEKEAASQQKA